MHNHTALHTPPKMAKYELLKPETDKDAAAFAMNGSP
jgi:hypothetical protein